MKKKKAEETIVFEDGSGFKDALLKRASKRSTVGVIETSDKMRYEDYLRRIEDLLAIQKKEMVGNKRGTGWPIEILLVDIFNGIRELRVNITSDVEDTFKVDSVIVPLGAKEPQAPDKVKPMVPLNSSLPQLAALLKRPEIRTLAVITGLIDDQATMNVLEMFVNEITIDGNMFQYGSMVFILTPDAALLPRSVLSNAWVIRPKPSTRDERRRILEEVIGYRTEAYKKKYDDENPPPLLDKSVDHFVDVTDGLNLNDFQSSCLESLIRNELRHIRFSDVVQSKVEIVNSLKGVRIDLLENAKGFASVGGYEEIKSWYLRKVVEVYNNHDLAKRMKITTPRGVLMFGPPGTGKTHLTRNLARDLDCVFVEIMWEQLMSKWVGESESNLNELLSRIDAMGDKVVVFFDEVDSLGRRGTATDTHKTFDSMFSRLLKWMSDPNRKCLVIGATNTPDRLDPAFIRDQRFDKLIYMGLPDQAARKEIFVIKFRETGLKLDKSVDLDALALDTKWYSGANIEGIVKEAQTIAFERVLHGQDTNEVINAEDVRKAMAVKRKNTQPIEDMNKRYLEYAEEHCDDRNLIITEGRERPQAKDAPDLSRKGRLAGGTDGMEVG